MASQFSRTNLYSLCAVIALSWLVCDIPAARAQCVTDPNAPGFDACCVPASGGTECNNFDCSSLVGAVCHPCCHVVYCPDVTAQKYCSNFGSLSAGITAEVAGCEDDSDCSDVGDNCTAYRYGDDENWSTGMVPQTGEIACIPAPIFVNTAHITHTSPKSHTGRPFAGSITVPSPMALVIEAGAALEKPHHSSFALCTSGSAPLACGTSIIDGKLRIAGDYQTGASGSAMSTVWGDLVIGVDHTIKGSGQIEFVEWSVWRNPPVGEVIGGRCSANSIASSFGCVGLAHGGNTVEILILNGAKLTLDIANVIFSSAETPNDFTQIFGDVVMNSTVSFGDNIQDSCSLTLFGDPDLETRAQLEVYGELDGGHWITDPNNTQSVAIAIYADTIRGVHTFGIDDSTTNSTLTMRGEIAAPICPAGNPSNITIDSLWFSGTGEFCGSNGCPPGTLAPPLISSCNDPCDPNNCDVPDGSIFVSFVPADIVSSSAYGLRVIDWDPCNGGIDGDSCDSVYRRYEGRTFWLGEPAEYDDTINGATFYASELERHPVFSHDWSNHDVLYVYGLIAIQPNSSFEIFRVTSSGCQSEPIMVYTRRWGDVACVSGVDAINFMDIAGVISAFRGLTGTAQPRAQLGLVADGKLTIDLNIGIDFMQIRTIVDRFLGQGYPAVNGAYGEETTCSAP